MQPWWAAVWRVKAIDHTMESVGTGTARRIVAMKKREPEIDRPRVYYTSRGERYVKAEELLQSTRGRDAVKRMAAFKPSRQSDRKSLEQPDVTRSRDMPWWGCVLSFWNSSSPWVLELTAVDRRVLSRFRRCRGWFAWGSSHLDAAWTLPVRRASMLAFAVPCGHVAWCCLRVGFALRYRTSRRAAGLASTRWPVGSCRSAKTFLRGFFRLRVSLQGSAMD